MKHLLNNISQEEKNRILEQHKGGKSIDTTRFKALLESKSGNVKPLIMERPTGTPVSGTQPNPSVGTKPKQAITPAVTVKPNTIAKERNWVKVIAYSDEAATQAFTNINIDSQMIKLVGNDVKFNYIVAGKPQEEGIGTFYCNSKNTMSFDGKPLTGTMYISDARVDTLKSKCGGPQGYASTNPVANPVVDKNFA
jgi:hypothetical protein